MSFISASPHWNFGGRWWILHEGVSCQSCLVLLASQKAHPAVLSPCHKVYPLWQPDGLGWYYQCSCSASFAEKACHLFVLVCAFWAEVLADRTPRPLGGRAEAALAAQAWDQGFHQQLMPILFSELLAAAASPSLQAWAGNNIPMRLDSRSVPTNVKCPRHGQPRRSCSREGSQICPAPTTPFHTALHASGLLRATLHQQKAVVRSPFQNWVPSSSSATASPSFWRIPAIRSKASATASAPDNALLCGMVVEWEIVVCTCFWCQHSSNTF